MNDGRKFQSVAETVKQLFENGITLEVVAEVLNISFSTAGNYKKNAEKQFNVVFPRKTGSEVYRDLLTTHAHKAWIALQRGRETVFDKAVAITLEFEKLLLASKSMGAMLTTLTSPCVAQPLPVHLIPYWNFMQKQCLQSFQQVEVDVCGFLKSIGEGNIDISNVKNLNTLLPLLAESQSNYRSKVVSVLDVEVVKKFIDQALESLQLSEREKSILTMFYGIGKSARAPISLNLPPEEQKRERRLQEKLRGRSLEEIGDELGLTRERVRQILEKIEKRLLKDIRVNGDSITDLLIYERKVARPNEKITSLKEETKYLEVYYQQEIDKLGGEKQIIYDGSMLSSHSPIATALSFLTTSIEELQCSVRLLNCCRSKDFKYIYELANKDSLRECRNFGKKSLNELDDIFVSAGLDRMQVSEALIRTAKELIQEKIKAE
ncbi:MAG: hypothetical protein LBO09_06370 [Candidatus Peribacteria bacterium]|jgi:RNA polymerase sigma factor (sigma-70 family)|nr:hypothetical protein [Candidatus Peribacteria bacterium]